jgi:bacterioferritin
MNETEKSKAIEALNRILELEMTGAVRYSHYSLMVYGYNRIPIVNWLREQAQESMDHAHRAGELVTALGGHPSLAIGPLLETHKHDVGDILRESLAHEREGLEAYRRLLGIATGKSVLLEEYTRELIAKEEMHVAEVDKMLRKPGDVEVFSKT